MAQKRLGKLYPKIEGDPKFGFKYASFITTDTAFAASAGLSGTAVAGQLRYDTSDSQFKFWNGSAEVALAAASASGTGLDGNYDINPTITVDGATLTMAGTNVDVLTVTQSANDDIVVLNKTGTGAGNVIDITNAGTGKDIDGHGSAWHITSAGVATFGNIVGNDLTLTDSTVSITTDVTSTVAMAIECDTLTTGTALEIDSNTGANVTLLDLQNNGTSTVKVSGSGIMTLAGVAKNADAIAITAGDITLTAGDIDMSSGQFSLITDQAGDGMTITDTTGGGNYDLVYLNGTTSTGSGHILSIAQGASLRTGHAVDISMGATAVAMSAIDISCTGGTRTKSIIAIDSDGTASDFIEMQNSVIFTGNFIEMIQDTSAATGNFIFINNDSGTSMEAINIDDEVNTADIIKVDSAGVLGAGKAQLSLTQSAGAVNATANAILVDWTADVDANTPIMVKLDADGRDINAMTIDSDAVTDVVLINGGGALTNGEAVLALTNDGTLGTGGNVFSIDVGGTPHVAAIAAEITAAKDCQALFINTAAATDSAVEITGTGAVADNKALLELNWTSTPANAGSNMLRIDGSGGTNTIKPVLCEIYDSGVAVGLSVSTASIEDMVTFIGTGATGADKGVVDITSTATLDVGGNLLRIDGSGATTTSKPVLLEVLDNSVSTAASFTSLPTANHVVLVAAGGAMTDGYAGLMVTSSGNLATGGAASHIVISGSPTNDSRAFEIDAQKDMRAVYIDTDAVTNNAVEITAGAAIATGKAALAVTNTGAIATGAYLLDLTTGANFASSSASYALHVDATHDYCEGIHVDAGNSKFDEGIGFGNYTVEAVTASVDGVGAVISNDVNSVQLTSTNTDHWVVLPAPIPGKVLWIAADATSACELRASAAGVSMNSVAGATSEVCMIVDTLYRCYCKNATNWIITKHSPDGTIAKADAAD